MSKLLKLLTIPLFAFTLLIGSVAHAKGPIFEKSGAAIRGYDTVAYFTESRPVKGSPDFSTEYKGANWHFSSAENLELFKSDPEKYAPQYGGYCAYAAANDKLVSTNPEAWHIKDGKLYLNYNNKVQKRWLEDVDTYIAEANVNYPNLVK